MQEKPVLMRCIKAVLCILIGIAPVIYLCLIWRQVPETVPLHFGFDGKPDRYGSRMALWALSGIQSVAAIGSYFLFDILYSKASGGPQPAPKFLPILGAVILLGMTAVNFYAMVECGGRL
jgi:hypothetical protein